MRYVLKSEGFDSILSGTDPVDAVVKEHQALDGCRPVPDLMEIEAFRYLLLEVPTELSDAIEQIIESDGFGEEGAYRALQLLERRSGIQTHTVVCTTGAAGLEATLSQPTA